jgi:hypothetical protein
MNLFIAPYAIPLSTRKNIVPVASFMMIGPTLSTGAAIEFESNQNVC